MDTLKLKHVAVVLHPQLKTESTEAGLIAAYLKNAGIETTVGLLNDEALRVELQAGKFELVVALGGDGTVLRAGHLCAPHGVPILGINLGHFGFLIETSREDWQTAMDAVLAGEYWIEDRMMLKAAHVRNGEVLDEWQVVNDAVISRGDWVRPVRLSAEMDGQLLAEYVTDALIVSTPTGSTAYALAAGGPILPPELRNILLVPVAPHLSMDRAVVMAEGVAITINVHSDNLAIVSVDGQQPTSLEEGDQIDVRVSDHTLQFVRFADANYFYRNLVGLMDQNPSAGKRG